MYNEKKVKRTISLLNEGGIKVYDEIETGKTEKTLRWNIVTEADFILDNNKKKIVLNKGGETITMSIKTELDCNIRSWSSKPENTYENQNDGVYIVGFESKLPKNTTNSFEILFE